MLELLLAIFALGLVVLSFVFKTRQFEAIALAVALLAITHILPAV